MSASDVNLSPPAKRRHTESTKDEIRKHENLYLYDGDIALLSLPKDGIITAFRVDKVFLSRHSLVFKGMLALPSPTDIEKFDGVPLVRLPDEAEHLVSFLSALYDLGSIPHKKLSSDTVSRVEGALKLATKYEADKLRRRIIDHLVADWPQTLTVWDANEAEMAIITARVWSNDHLDRKYNQFPEPCSAIHLARDLNIPEILPAAFYYLSRIPIFADIDAPNDVRLGDYLFDGGHRARFALLSCIDLMCLLKGTQEIAEYMVDLFSENLILERIEDQDGCMGTDEGLCLTLMHKAVGAYRTSTLHSRDALHVLQKDEEIEVTELCGVCGNVFGTYITEKREKLWAELPCMFGLNT